jgi:hypothetical protein
MSILVLDPILPLFGPSLYWALDKRNTATDLTDNARNGTAAGGMTLGAFNSTPGGLTGYSTDFDGTNDAVTSSYNPFIAGSARTFSWWAFTDRTTPASDTFFSGSGTNRPVCRLGTDSTPTDVVFDADVASGGTSATWTNAWTAAGWSHGCLTFDDSTNTAELYVNGVSLGAVATVTDPFNASAGNFQIGLAGASTAPLDGRMAHVCVFERILTPGEVQHLYESQFRDYYKRSELDLDSGAIRVRSDGIDWGESLVEQSMVDTQNGSLPIDFRVPNRVVKIPLRIDNSDVSVPFETARLNLQAKVAQIQREGGRIRRAYTGGALFADVVNASLDLPDSWFAAYRSVEPDAILTLECVPDFYGHEQLVATGSGSPHVTITATGVEGNYPGRVRALLTNGAAAVQSALLFANRSRQVGEATALMAYDATALTPMGGAAISGSQIAHTDIPTRWISILSTQILSGSHLTHAGPHRVWAQIDPGTSIAEGQQVRLEWHTGNVANSRTNDAVTVPLAARTLVDLGEIISVPSKSGLHRWEGRIAAKATIAGGDINIRKLYILPSESSGRIAANLQTSTPSTLSARSEFNTEAGAITGDALSTGGTWQGAGDADDFTITGAAPTATVRRSPAAVDTAGGAVQNGRLVGPSTPTALTDSAVSIDFNFSSVSAPYPGYPLAILRYIDQNNFAVAYVDLGLSQVVVQSRVASVTTTVASASWFNYIGGSWHTLQFTAYANGNFEVKLGLQGIQTTVLAGYHSSLQTGGGLASGQPRFGEYRSSLTGTADYDNFAAWVPTVDSVIKASGRAELRSDGYVREADIAPGRLPVIGGLPRQPVAGPDSLSTEWFLRPSRGNVTAAGEVSTIADSTDDTLSAVIMHRPSWLVLPA